MGSWQGLRAHASSRKPSERLHPYWWAANRSKRTNLLCLPSGPEYLNPAKSPVLLTLLSSFINTFSFLRCPLETWLPVTMRRMWVYSVSIFFVFFLFFPQLLLRNHVIRFSCLDSVKEVSGFTIHALASHRRPDSKGNGIAPLADFSHSRIKYLLHLWGYLFCWKSLILASIIRKLRSPPAILMHEWLI